MRLNFLRSIKESTKKAANEFNLTSHDTDELISINSSRYKIFLKDIYPEDLVVPEISES